MTFNTYETLKTRLEIELRELQIAGNRTYDVVATKAKIRELDREYYNQNQLG